MEKEVVEGYRLSPQQKHLTLLQAAGTRAPYCVQFSILIEGKLEPQILEETLSQLVERHEILRTTFRKFQEMDYPLQVINERVAPSLSKHDARQATEAEQQSLLASLLKTARDEAAEFKTGAALHASLLELAADRHILSLTLPALCADYGTCRILLSELARLYAEGSRAAADAEEPVQYADLSQAFNELLESEETRAGREYWETRDIKARLSDALPFEKRASANAEIFFDPRRIDVKLSPDTLARVEEFARERGALASEVFTSCWQALLARLLRADEVMLGVYQNARTHPDIQDAPGLLDRYLPIACRLEGSKSFDELLKLAQDEIHEVGQWGDYFSWEMLEGANVDVEARALFCPFAFEWLDQPEAYAHGALKFSVINQESLTERFKVKLSCHVLGEQLVARLYYDGALFEASDMQRLAREFETLIRSVLDNSQETIGALNILDEDERRQVLFEFNRTERKFSADLCLDQLFEEQARRTPDNVAVVFEDQRLSYGELNERANQLARRLLSLGVKQEEAVCIYLERSVNVVVSLLAVLKAGGAFVPLDPSHPPQRVARLLADCRPRVILTETALADNVPAHEGLEIIRLDTPSTEIASQSAENVERLTSGGNAAYIMYTSGSTGQPKGVIVEHRQLLNYLWSILDKLQLQDNASYALVSTFAADLGYTTVFASLSTGASLHLISVERSADADAMAAYFQEHQIDCLKIVPSHLAALMASIEPQRIMPRRQLILGGETATPELLSTLQKLETECELINHYGPTETTIGVLTYRAGALDSIEPGTGLPLGRPLYNTQVYLLDEHLNPVPLGVVGQLCVAGQGLARGYLNNPDATADKYIPHPFNDEAGARLYLTGDLARYRADGQIEFLGRADHQVKVRGYRLELGEVEATLRQHEGVREAVVVAQQDGAGAAHLMAYVVPQLKYAPSIRGQARYALPNGMSIMQKSQDETDAIYKDIFARQLYLKHDIELREGDCVFDVGAHVGLFTLFLSGQQKGLRVFSFEPIEELSSLLSINASLYGDDVKVFPFGLAQAEATGRITFYPRSPMMSVLSDYADSQRDMGAFKQYVRSSQGEAAPETYATPAQNDKDAQAIQFPAEAHQCRLRRLSNIMREEGIERINLLKVSVGRGGLEVLRGVDAEDWRKIDQLVMIIHDDAEEKSEQQQLHKITALLREHGFVPVVEQDDTSPGRYLMYAARSEKDAKVSEDSVDETEKRAPLATYKHETLSAVEMRAYLRSQLPEYQIPTAFVFLEELPLTPNGKVDRQALAAFDAPQVKLENEYVAPRTSIEEVIANIWSSLLGVETIGAHDNFFELGGHSLLAMQLASRLRNSLHVETPLHVLFEAPTVASLAAYVDDALRNAHGLISPPLVPVSRQEDLSLSFAQQRLWFLDQLNPGLSNYNLATAIRLTGLLNPGALNLSINEVIRRHEVLRTTLPTFEGRPVQLIADQMKIELPVRDLSHLPIDERELEAARLAREEAALPFDLAAGPLFRATLLRLGDEEHVALFTMHHIISDGWSMALLVMEMSTLYEAFLTGQPSPLSELPIQYADYSVWQRNWMSGKMLEQHLEYWQAQLANAPKVTELPTDRPRPPIMRFHGAWEYVSLPKGLSEALNLLSKREGVTLYMALLTAFQILLYRYSGQSDIIIGSPIAGRNRTEIESLIGFFVNTLLLRTDLSGDPTFKQLLKRVREMALEAYAHQDVPFEKIVEELQPERDLSRQPLFQVVFALGNVPRPSVVLPGLTITPFEDDEQGKATDEENEKRTSKFDLTVSLRETANGLTGAVEYNTDLFDASTIRRLLSSWQSLLEVIVAQPDHHIKTLPILTDEETNKLLFEFNRTNAEYPKEKTIQRLFEEQATETPDSIALIFGAEQLTYRELNLRANQLAHYLRRAGVGPEIPVGLLMERSTEMITGLLGILKAGGHYVPLDPTSPQERLLYMIEDAGIKMILAQKHLGFVLPPQTSVEVFYQDTQASTLSDMSEENPNVETLPESLAYISYTSGSTGMPKGVSIPHRAVSRLVRQDAYADFAKDEVFLHMAPLSFDASTFEIWGGLLNGSRLVVMPPQQPTLEEIGTTLREQGVTTLWLTAGLFHVMVDHRLEDLKNLRQLLAGGDVLSVPHVQKFLAEAQGCSLTNGYGPTESTTFACCHRMRGAMDESTGQHSIPIGRPIANTRVYILDDYGQPVAIGVIGELYIGGDGLARGYSGQPELTAQKFVPDALSGEAGARLYRTGDLVRYLPDGRIEFVGRVDLQVKIRGFRIEMGEIEIVLGHHTAVRETVVMAREDEPGDKRLVAYVVMDQEQVTTINDLRSFLKQRLPDYMIPQTFVMLEKLPLTDNGKVDRAALPPPPEERVELDENYIAPRDTVELLLTQIWEDVLDLPRVGVQSNFFELGGNSILAVILIARIDRVLGVHLPLHALFQGATIEHLGIMLRQEKSTLPYSTLVAIQPRGNQAPFFCIHPAGGTVHCYADLARNLGMDQPFYAFQASGLDENEEFDTQVEAMAARYIESMRAVQPVGPYRLGGWSLGGVIAYEMARQLKEAGEEVSLLALLDAGLANSIDKTNQPGSPSASHASMVDDAELLHLIFNEMLGDTIWRSLEHLRTLNLDQQLEFVMEQARKANKMVPDYQLTQAQRLFSLFKNNVTAVKNYQPRQYPGRIVLFRPSEELPEGTDNLTRDWDKLAAAGVEVHVVPGTHQNMLTEPHVIPLAEMLVKHLDEAQAESAGQVVIRLMDASGITL